MPIETRRKAGSTAKVGDALSAPIESGQHLATVAAMEVPPQFVNVERPQISTEIHDDPVDDEKSLELSKIFLILAVSQ